MRTTANAQQKPYGFHGCLTTLPSIG